MANRPASLYIVFTGPDPRKDRLQDVKRYPWSAPKDAKPGDMALFYFGGSGPGIRAVGRTAAKAEFGIPDAKWTDSTKGYFARHTSIQTLRQPLSLKCIREVFPDLGGWKALRGVRVHIVPEIRRIPLAAPIGEANPDTRGLFAP